MQPTEHQKRAIAKILASKKPVAWLGDIRAGKTVGACMALTEKMQARPGTYLIGCYTYGNFDRNVAPPLERHFQDEGIEYSISRRMPYRIDVPTLDSIIWIMSGVDESQQNTLQGVTLQGAFVDEVLLITQSFMMQLVGRLSEENPLLLMTANKGSPAHWIKTDWIDTGKVECIESTTSDNPHISDETLDWYDSLIIGHYRDTMLSNQWRAPGNMIAPQVLHDIERDFPDLAIHRRAVYVNPHSRVGWCVCEQHNQHFVITEMGEADLHENAVQFDRRMLTLVNDCEGDWIPFNAVRCKVSKRAWTEALNSMSVAGKLFCSHDVAEDVNARLGKWVWEREGKPQETDPANFALSMLVNQFGKSVQPISGRGMRI